MTQFATDKLQCRHKFTLFVYFLLKIHLISIYFQRGLDYRFQVTFWGQLIDVVLKETLLQDFVEDFLSLFRSCNRIESSKIKNHRTSVTFDWL